MAKVDVEGGEIEFDAEGMLKWVKEQFIPGDPGYIMFPHEAQIITHEGMKGVLTVGRTPMFGVWKVGFLPLDGKTKGASLKDYASEEEAVAFYRQYLRQAKP